MGTTKITGAMKLIATSKLKRAQQRMLNARLYNDSLKELALQAAAKSGEITHPAFILRPKVRKATVLVITPERGFCGALSEEMFGQIRHFLDMMKDRGVGTSALVVGSKGAQHFGRHEIEFEEIDLGFEDPLINIKVENLCNHLLDIFLSGEADQILLAYSRFVSAVSHQVALEIFLPVWVKKGERPVMENEVDFIYEPDKSRVLELVLKKALRTKLYQALFEAGASELAARMVAMDKALKNARDMVERLTRRYHRVRQSTITRELLDIIGGAEALKG